MEKWNRHFIRQGFSMVEKTKDVFKLDGLMREDREFLLEVLNKTGADFRVNGNLLRMESTPVSEEEWLEATDSPFRGRTEASHEFPPVQVLDVYMSGLIRQLKRLGFQTLFCCDGHGERFPSIVFQGEAETAQAVLLLQAAGIRKIEGRRHRITLRTGRERLLDIAEHLNSLRSEHAWQPEQELKKFFFLQLLEECLSINGESGNERDIRTYVIKQLRPHVDELMVDHAGNILARKRIGHGPEILLNAHLDTVRPFEPGREIVKNGPVWTSSAGILGADDRAGVALLLKTAEELASSSFRGTVKFIFTVQEESGLEGASEVDASYLKNVDAAFVLDRRGKGDIVTSCGGYLPFCSPEFGRIIEVAAAEAGLTGWRCTAGGSSDTRIWASHGVNSVNLSVGYGNEHTASEFLDTEACYGTLRLLKELLDRSPAWRKPALSRRRIER